MRDYLVVAAISKMDWSPTEYSSTHYISGQKTNDPLSLDSIFEHISTLSRIKRRNNFKAYRRRKNVFKRRLENDEARKKAAKKPIEVAKAE